VKPFAFVPPTEPVLAETPPKGKGWCHEVKFDGYRLQPRPHKRVLVGCDKNRRTCRMTSASASTR